MAASSQGAVTENRTGGNYVFQLQYRSLGVQQTPREKYEQETEAVGATLQKAKVTRETLKPQGVRPPRITIETGDMIPGTLGLSAGGVTLAAASKVGKGFFQGEVPELRAEVPRGAVAAPSSKNWMWGVVVAGAAALATTGRYLWVAAAIRNKAARALEAIADDETNRERFLGLANEAYTAKEESYFKGAVELFNPDVAPLILLAVGIARDSENNHQAAQAFYNQALEYDTPPGLEHRLRFVYARSLILSNAADNFVQAQANGIPEESPFQRLYDMRVEAAGAQPNNAIFNGAGVPFDFICSITQDVFVDPVWYEVNNHRYFAEREAITQWVQMHHDCPITREPLEEPQLETAHDLAILIQAWRENKLKTA